MMSINFKSLRGVIFLIFNLFFSTNSFSSVSEQLYPYCLKYIKKCGYINEQGNWVIEPYFNSHDVGFFPFSEGLAPVKVDGKYGYINTQGKMVIESQYLFAGQFKSGLAKVQLDNERGTSGFINKHGKLVITAKFSFTGAFENGLAKAANFDYKEGVINLTGNWVIKPKYESVTKFSEGLLAVKKNDKWGYVDKQDKLIISFIFDEALEFRSGLAAARMGNKMGLINRDGQWVIAPKYESIFGFSDGLYAAKNKGLSGYIDKQGQWIINPKYQDVKPFFQGLAAVKTQGLYGMIDANGNWVIMPKYKSIGLSWGYWVLSDRDKREYLNKKRKLISPVECNSNVFNNAVEKLVQENPIRCDRNKLSKRGMANCLASLGNGDIHLGISRFKAQSNYLIWLKKLQIGISGSVLFNKKRRTEFKNCNYAVSYINKNVIPNLKEKNSWGLQFIVDDNTVYLK